MTGRRARLMWGAIVACAVAFVVLAHAQLVHVAETTQPKCVEHVKAGGEEKPPGAYIAAKSSC